ncbi:MAG TPA: 3'(2'),5'-bisphosphate nucleotidase CysQ [Steroidobacteraceae bacterium]|nr:3'(2'),5'-bisphosphate nucleotidase CysQ [Steroidobacteraceae bacterium]
MSADSRPTALFEAMIAAAIQAGRIAHTIYRGDFEVTRKADHSPVTQADHAAEALILRALAAAAPGIPVIAEEEVSAGRVPAIGERFFLVDPLDGTKEFVQKRGDFTVNIALIEQGEPVLGVVYAPANSRLFAGEVRAHRAFRSDQSTDTDIAAPRIPIQVRPVPAGGLTVVSSRSHATPETDAYLASYRISERVAVGSSLKFCLVACAEADLYPRLGPTMEWDTAAGHAVLLAAGGNVWAPGGLPLRYGKTGFRNPFFVASGTLIPHPLAA